MATRPLNKPDKIVDDSWKFGSGRPKGATNKSTREFAQYLREHGFNLPATYMAMFEKALQGYESAGREEAPQYLAIATKLLDSMASFSVPKLKSIEVTQGSPLEGMTTEEKLEATKKAQVMLEEQLKQEQAIQIKGK